MNELAKVKEDVEQLKEDVEEIKDNHLSCIFTAVMMLNDKVKTNRWMFMGGMALLGLVIGLVQCFG